jgi:hypothetical protein
MTASARALLRSVAGPLQQAGPAPATLGTRWMSVVRAGYGAALLCVPGPMITAVTGAPASGRVRTVARVLGARQLVQAAVCGLAPGRRLVQAGAAADGLHSASMLALAGTEPTLRRALLADGAIASAFASVATISLGRKPQALGGQEPGNLAEASRHRASPGGVWSSG